MGAEVMNSKMQKRKNIQTKINNSIVTISFVNQSEKPATDAVISVLSAIYGNRLKQELGLVEK